MSNRLNDRAKVENNERWEYWREKIPAMVFPSHWQIRVPPPWGFVLTRLWVDPVGIVVNPRAPTVCVYLDVYDPTFSEGGPFWEIHPSPDEDDDGCWRCGIDEVDKLLAAIDAVILRRIRYGRRDKM